MKILVLNGPNLNLLGTREPDVYGTTSLALIEEDLRSAFPAVGFLFVQSNHEGTLVDALHDASADRYDGVVLNPAAYSHTSIALRDAILAIDVPVVEVHLSNIYARERFRHHSMTAAACIGVLTGLGADGYRLAVDHLVRRGA